MLSNLSANWQPWWWRGERNINVALSLFYLTSGTETSQTIVSPFLKADDLFVPRRKFEIHESDRISWIALKNKSVRATGFNSGLVWHVRLCCTPSSCTSRQGNRKMRLKYDGMLQSCDHLPLCEQPHSPYQVRVMCLMGHSRQIPEI